MPSTTPKQTTPGSTSSRPSFYLVSKAPDSLSLSKLPKAGVILGRPLVLMELKSLSEASQIVREEVQTVWLHHFGPNLMLGKKFGDEANDITDEKLKIVKTDQRITEKIVEMYRKWKSLEGESRRPDRAVKPSFLKKQEQMLMDLDMPLDIKKANAETIIQNSRILDWREEVEYLRSQMTREQESSLGCKDTRQKKRDARKFRQDLSKESAVEKSKESDDILRKRKLEFEKDNVVEEFDENGNDIDFVVNKDDKKPKDKINVMKKISTSWD